MKPRPPPRNTIPPGAQSAERMLGVLGKWFLASNGHEDLVRRNRSLLKLWKKCAVECNWDSWLTLRQDWKEQFLYWGNKHISDINHTNHLCFSALTRGWEDFTSNTCCVIATWGLNAFSALATMVLLAPTPLSKVSAISHRIFFRTDEIAQPEFCRMNELLLSECFFLCTHNR